MAYSIKKCKEIRNRVDEVGIYEAAIEYKKSFKICKT
jgi:hypothetical protein